MRSDLAKLTTEKERRGGTGESKKYGGKIKVVHDLDHDYDNEYGGFRSSSRRKVYGYNCKELSDVLNPLRGALRANLGRPWDKVYSEFCQNLDRRSVSGIHIFGHLCGSGGEVTVKGLYVGEDCKVYEHYAGYSSGYGDHEVSGFYVHPVTGILCYKEQHYSSHGYHKKAVLKSLRQEEGVIEIDGHEYERIDDIWFEIWRENGVKEDWQPCWLKNATAEEHAKHSYRQCVQHKKTGEWGSWHLTKTMVVIRKRSLNKKEIKMVKQYILDRIKELELE